MDSQPGGRYGTQLPQRSSTLASPSELRRSPSATSINSDAHLDSHSIPGHSSSLADHSQPLSESSLAAPTQFNRSGYSQEQRQRSTSSRSDDTHTRSNHNQYSNYQYLQQQQQQQQSLVPVSVCAECGNNVTGQFVRALGVVFHKDCFRCKVCSSTFFYRSRGCPALRITCETLATKYPPCSHSYISDKGGAHQPLIDHALFYPESPRFSMHPSSHKTPLDLRSRKCIPNSSITWVYPLTPQVPTALIHFDLFQI